MKHFFLSLALAFTCHAGFSQNLIASFSPKFEEQQKKAGLSYSVIGSTKDLIYVESYSIKGRVGSSKIWLKMVKKSDLSIQKEVLIYDKETNKDEENKHIAAYRFGEDRILVYYAERRFKDTKNLFGRAYDMELNPKSQMQTLYSVPNTKEFKGISFIREYSSDNSKVMVGAEFPAKKGGSPYIDYRILNSDFTQLHAGKFEMPVKITSKSARTSNSSFALTNEGNIYFSTTVSIPKEDRKSLAKGEDPFFTTFSFVNAQSGEIKTVPIKFAGKNIFGTSKTLLGNQIKIVGFYSDLEDDRTGDKVSGIFSALIETQTLTITSSEFKRFTKEEILSLSDLNLEKRKDRKKADKMTDDNVALDSDIRVEHIRTDESGNTYLFCSKMINDSYTICTGRGQCTTYYYCDKVNVYVFKLSVDGKLVYGKKFPRNYRYNTWYVYDQRLFYSGGKYFLTFDTNKDRDSSAANLAIPKGKRLSVTANEKLEFLVVDTKTDEINRQFLSFNSPDVPRKKRLRINPLDLQDMGGEFYAVQNDYFVPAGTQVLNTVLSLATFPIYYVFIRPFVRRNAMRSKTQYVRVFAN